MERSQVAGIGHSLSGRTLRSRAGAPSLKHRLFHERKWISHVFGQTDADTPRGPSWRTNFNSEVTPSIFSRVIEETNSNPNRSLVHRRFWKSLRLVSGLIVISTLGSLIEFDAEILPTLNVEMVVR